MNYYEQQAWEQAQRKFRNQQRLDRFLDFGGGTPAALLALTVLLFLARVLGLPA